MCQSKGAVVIPGEKLCPSCRTFDLSKCNQECNETPTADSPIASCRYIEASELNQTRESLNTTLQELDISLLKIHAVANHSKSSRAKLKLKQVECAVSRKIAKVLSVDETLLSVKTTSSKNKERDEKARDLDCLILRMKEKLAKASRREKLQMLTLNPESWSLRIAGKRHDPGVLKNQRNLKIKSTKCTIKT